MIFDLVELDGESLADVPWVERRRRLETVVDAGPGWQVPPVHDDPTALLALITDRAMEGIVVKHRQSRYRPGRRSDAWVKVKAARVDDFLVGGWFEGTGARQASFGSLAIGTPTDAGEAGRPDGGEAGLRYVGAVGSGFDQMLLTRLRVLLDQLERPTSPFVEGQPPTGLRPVDPMISVRVRYGEWTPDGVLRHPVMVGLTPASDIADEPDG
jgi:bifunctional non-homologous end joining protein LigD